MVENVQVRVSLRMKDLPSLIGGTSCQNCVGGIESDPNTEYHHPRLQALGLVLMESNFIIYAKSARLKRPETEILYEGETLRQNRKLGFSISGVSRVCDFACLIKFDFERIAWLQG